MRSALAMQPRYWPKYCEENVWHQCGEPAPGVDEALAVFISSPAQRVSVWCQRTETSPDTPCHWDYHVILLQRLGASWQVVDLDSTLGAPVPAADYLTQSFRPLPERYAERRPHFRLVSAAEYRDRLCSDRSHMRSASGRWLSSPPPWPCIGEGMNLMRFVDMQRDWLGEVCDLPGLRQRLGLSAP